MREGWIPAYRRVYEPDHWLAPTARDPSCRRDAWFDLLSMAAYQPRETKDSGTIGRGELVASLRTLAKRWKWHRSRVERFVNELEVRTAIGTVRETPDGTVYRIVNYETYAVGDTDERDSERDKNRDSGETAARQEGEVKKGRTKKTTLSDPLFEEAKKNYPKRTGGQGWADAEIHWRTHLKAGVDPQTILQGVERYRLYVEHEGVPGNFIKMASTFFGPGKHFTEEWHFNGNGNRQEQRAFLPGSAGSVLR